MNTYRNTGRQDDKAGKTTPRERCQLKRCPGIQTISLLWPLNKSATPDGELASPNRTRGVWICSHPHFQSDTNSKLFFTTSFCYFFPPPPILKTSHWDMAPKETGFNGSGAKNMRDVKRESILDPVLFRCSKRQMLKWSWEWGSWQWYPGEREGGGSRMG